MIGGAVVLVQRPGSGAAIALLATLNALAWGLIVPPFHVPDEPAHAFYAQYLGETGKLPASSGDADWYSGDVTQALAATSFYYVIGQPDDRPSWDVTLPARRRPDRHRERRDRVEQPAAVLRRPGRGLSRRARPRRARPAGADARPVGRAGGPDGLCVFAFLRELLPGSPLAWTVGALLAGLMPMFAYIASGREQRRRPLSRLAPRCCWRSPGCCGAG